MLRTSVLWRLVTGLDCFANPPDGLSRGPRPPRYFYPGPGGRTSLRGHHGQVRYYECKASCSNSVINVRRPLHTDVAQSEQRLIRGWHVASG